MNNQKIIAIGSIYLDINTSNFPFNDSLPAESETVGGSYFLSPGGSALNYARVLAFLDLQPTLIGKIGNDTPGSILKDLITKTGTEPDLILSDQDQTNLGINFTNTAGSTITTNVGTANQSLNPDDVITKLKSHIKQVDYLYLSSFFKLKNLIPKYPEIISLAKNSNTSIILDPGDTANIATGDERNLLLSLMPQVDVYLPNIEELLDLWQSKDISYALGKVQNTTKATIVVKMAEKGAMGVNNQQSFIIPSFPIAPINSIGAGDSFNAGFTKALSLNLDLENAVKYANATAALTISQKHLANHDQIQKFITTHQQAIIQPS